MGISISFGLQKGGVGKTTTTAITSFLLAEKNKVLAIDLDSQGNLTEMLTGEDVYDFDDKTIYEAVIENDLKKYIHEVNERLHVVPAGDAISMLPNYLARKYVNRKKQLESIKNIVDKVKDDYDYVLIDLPPALGDQTLCGLAASDYTVVVLQTEPFAYKALERYLETLEMVKEKINQDLVLSGVLTCLMQSQANIDSEIRKVSLEEYEGLVFDTVIKRKTRIKEFAVNGISRKNRGDKHALENYENFLEELLESVRG